MSASSPFRGGTHLIADIAATRGLGDAAWIEAMLREAADAARVTVLEVRLHHFGPECGVTGVALLAESHISIHTWPEHGLAAIDVFVCGANANPRAALAVIEARLAGQATCVSEVPRLTVRGQVPDERDQRRADQQHDRG